MSIMDKLKKNSKVKETSILADSKFFMTEDTIEESSAPFTAIYISLSSLCIY